MNEPFYYRKLEKALDRQGGLYTLSDILERIAQGTMQSWVHNNSWAVTQISVYPRRRVLEVVAVVGDLGDCRILNSKLVKFANDVGVDLIASFGRRGWVRLGDSLGWKIKAESYLYHKGL